MLHFNREDVPSGQEEFRKGDVLSRKTLEDEMPSWKILIYDKFGRDIISPLLKVGELREHEVTLHM
jgi:hypothetical protein